MSSIAFPPDETTTTVSHAAPHQRINHSTPTADELRAERNRRNAQRSTGPRTPAGKARSARNARTHGLCSATPPTDLPVPDPCATLEFTTALQELVDEHRPATPTQHALVKELALVLWKLDYVPRLEHRLLNTPLPHAPPEPDPSHITPHPRLDHPANPTARVIAAHFACDKPTPLTRLYAHHARLQARAHSLLNQLRQLKRDQRNQHADDTGETWRRAYNQRNAESHRILVEESHRIHEANQRKADHARRRDQLSQTAPTCSNPPPPTPPAQNEPTPPSSPLCLRASVPSVSFPAPPQPGATPRNAAQQTHHSAQNEPTLPPSPSRLRGPSPHAP